MSVQIKKNGVWEAVAGNATNTSGITESSALANIGTAANATQHEVNVAIDNVIEEMQHAVNKTIKPITNISSFQSSDLIGAKIVGINCYLYNGAGGYFVTANIIVTGNYQCLTASNPVANERGVRGIALDNSTGTLTFGTGYSIENGTFLEDNNWCYPISYFVLSY